MFVMKRKSTSSGRQDAVLPEKEGNPPQEKVRRCLVCRDKFTSSWPGNRVCKKCRASALWRQGC